FTRRNIALFRDDQEGETFLFQNPRELIIAEEPEALMQALDRADKAVREGRWVAGYVSYEAGYLLDPALTELLPVQRNSPLLVLGVFDAPATSSEEPGTGVEPPSLGEIEFAWDLSAYRERFD